MRGLFNSNKSRRERGLSWF